MERQNIDHAARAKPNMNRDQSQCTKTCDCLYKLLGLVKPSPEAASNITSAKRHYKEYMMRIQPDKTDDPRAHKAAILLNQAIRVLGSSKSERLYRSNGLRAVNQVHELQDVQVAIEFMTLKRSASETYRSVALGLPTNIRSNDISAGPNQSDDLNSSSNSRPKESSPVVESGKTERSMLINTVNGCKNCCTSDITSTATDYIAETTSKREIRRIIDHNIRPKKVFFIVEWSGCDRTDRVEARTLAENHGQAVSDYLNHLKIASTRRYMFLLNREPSLIGLVNEKKSSID